MLFCFLCLFVWLVCAGLLFLGFMLIGCFFICLLDCCLSVVCCCCCCCCDVLFTISCCCVCCLYCLFCGVSCCLDAVLFLVASTRHKNTCTTCKAAVVKKKTNLIPAKMIRSETDVLSWGTRKSSSKHLRLKPWCLLLLFCCCVCVAIAV